MTEDRNPTEEPVEAAETEAFEAPAIVSLGKLDAVTFGAAGPPFEGATSYF